MTDWERDEWPRLEHGQCKWFKVDADRNACTCKRLDHKNIKFAVPWFKSYDCGQFSGGVCRDFEPSSTCKWLVEHWDGFDGYFGKDHEFTGYCWLTVGEDKNIRYAVKREDFVNGNFMEDGFPKWVKKQYYKKSRKSPIGYELVTEVRDAQGVLRGN